MNYNQFVKLYVFFTTLSIQTTTNRWGLFVSDVCYGSPFPPTFIFIVIPSKFQYVCLYWGYGPSEVYQRVVSPSKITKRHFQPSPIFLVRLDSIHELIFHTNDWDKYSANYYMVSGQIIGLFVFCSFTHWSYTWNV